MTSGVEKRLRKVKGKNEGRKEEWTERREEMKGGIISGENRLQFK